MMAKNVNVPARVIESRPKTMSCARCTVNSTIDSNEEMVSGTFCFIGAPVGACAPCSGSDRSYGIPIAHDSLRVGFVFSKRQRANRQGCEARDAARSLRQFANRAEWFAGPAAEPPGSLQFARVMS